MLSLVSSPVDSLGKAENRQHRNETADHDDGWCCQYLPSTTQKGPVQGPVLVAHYVEHETWKMFFRWTIPFETGCRDKIWSMIKHGLLSRKMILVGSIGWHDRRCRTLPINPTRLEDLIRLYQVMKSNLTAPLSGVSPSSATFGKLINEEVEADVYRDEQSFEMRRRVLTAWKRLINSSMVCNLPGCCYPNLVS